MKKSLKKIIVMSDIHLIGGEEKLVPLDSVAKLETALSHAAQKHPDTAHLVFSGDLANNGKVEEYQCLKKTISQVGIPITFMMGNHDDRANFCKEFPDFILDENGYVQSSINVGECRLLFLDSLKQPYSDIEKK